MGKEIYETLAHYDAVFALGGKSLITILYAAGPIIPAGCLVYQLSADVRDLGRTYMTQLSVVGDIKASLRAMQPLLEAACGGECGSYAALVREAAAAIAQRAAAGKWRRGRPRNGTGAG